MRSSAPDHENKSLSAIFGLALGVLVACLSFVPVDAFQNDAIGYTSDLTVAGARCDGRTDDTVAIKKWLKAAHPGSQLRAPGGTCLFTEPLKVSSDGFALQGAGPYQTVFAYAGSDPTVDLLTIGDRTDCTRNVSLHGFRITSRTRMQNGTGLLLRRVCRSMLREVVIDGQDGGGLLWNGLWFDQVDAIVYRGYEARARNDAVRVNGGSGDGKPKAGLMMQQGKITGAETGLRIGGAFGGFSIDQTDIIANGTNVVVDTTLTAEGNREIFLGSQVAIDSSRTGPGILLADTLANEAAWLQLTGTWIATGPTDGLSIVSGANWTVAVQGGTIFNFNRDAIHNEAMNATLAINGPTLRYCGRNGIWIPRNFKKMTVQAAPIFIANKGGNVSVLP